MKLDTEFIRLPLRFDAARLEEEVAQFAEDAWRPHPEGAPGNTALQFVSAGGDPEDDATHGEMLPTPHLERCPYIRQVLASLGATIGRTRLMRIEAEGDLAPHADLSYYWKDRVRVHVPVVTRPEVEFRCADHAVHMGAGEMWIFDNWRPHAVSNPSSVRRIHLVIDTVGSSEFWGLVAAGERPFDGSDSSAEDRFVEFDAAAKPDLPTERVNRPKLMSPWEVEALIGSLDEDFAQLGPAHADGVASLREVLARHAREWRTTWAAHGDAASGLDAYGALLRRLDADLQPFTSLRLKNGVTVAVAVNAAIVVPAIDEAAVRGDAGRSAPPRPRTPRQRLDRPIIVVSSPRSGSSLLFETLAQSPSVWTIGGESHQLIESLPALNPANRGWHSNRLAEGDVKPRVVEKLSAGFLAHLRDRDGQQAPERGRLRLLEKTPKNALRVPFFARAYPDARFVYLYRDPRETISSMLDAWKSGRFVTYPKLPDWPGPPWSMLLVPGWRKLAGRDLPEIVAEQWATTTKHLLDDLHILKAERWCVASYDRLLAEPQAEIERICEFCEIEWDRDLSEGALPLSRHTLDSPAPEKWRRNADELKRIWPIVDEQAKRAHEVFAHPPATQPKRKPATAGVALPTDEAAQQQASHPFHSVHTSNMPEVLKKLGITLLVSTYQSGRLIAIREDEGSLNTHFRTFPTPMGIAVGRPGLALGTKRSVWLYRNQPEVAPKLQPQGKHDACFMPKMCHVTGDVAIHEIAFVGGGLWMVNTKFSCLATLDPDHSFVPRWRPPFVTKLAPEDRCHLNGFAAVDGEVRYVTALGETDEANGWRERKADGGIVMDVSTEDIIIDGLSMPHSPRMHDGKLWVLESGRGAVVTVDVTTGEKETVAELPGFTRGLAFAGRFAFVGLSQVRESVFGGIPLAERLSERLCGVWVLDTKTGSVVGFLRFEGSVLEIFDVQILHGIRYPEIAEPESEITGSSFVLPDFALADVPSPRT